MTNGWLVSRRLFFFKSLLLPFSLLAYMHIKNGMISHFIFIASENILCYLSPFPWPKQFQLPRPKLSNLVATIHRAQDLRSLRGPSSPQWLVHILSNIDGKCKFYLRLSNISVIPALSASSSILNLASSWSSFLKCRSTCFKEDQR